MASINQESVKEESIPTNISQIKRINKVISSASNYGGYVCGSYVRDVLVPFSQGHKFEMFRSSISLRFPTYDHMMNFLVDKAIMITDTDKTPWNEPEYVMYIKNSRNDGIAYNITISPNGLIKDADIDQLIATIDNETGTIVFDSTDDSLTVEDLIQRVNNKHVKVRAVCYQEAMMKNGVILHRLRRGIDNYTKQGWIVDQSEKPDDFESSTANHIKC